MLRTAAVLASLLLVGCTSRAAGGRGAQRSDVERVEVEGVARAYRLHAPPATDSAAPLPVLFVFHGAGSSPEDIEGGTGFDAMADAIPMIVVYPAALGGRFDTDSPAGTSKDVKFFDAILAGLRERHRVDDRRIFASGFSNGAAFCYRLGMDRPRTIAAIAPVAGYIPEGGATPGEPVPLLHVHGTADGRVGAPSTATAPDSPVALWARRNAASVGPISDPLDAGGGTGLRRFHWSGATNRADAQLMLIEDAGHQWSGGPGGFVSRAVLDFLLAHPRP